jgi:carboxylesterase type B
MLHQFNKITLLITILATIVTASPTVTNKILGTIHGITVNSTSLQSSEAFLGIPYAIPPLKSLRFAPALLWKKKLPQNNKTYNVFGDDCYQGGVSPDPTHPNQSEDCLTLNIWRPSQTNSSSHLSVMVFIYGGGFQGGASSVRWYNGAALSANQNVIVVSLNYRVGALGFLASTEISSMYSKGNGGLNGIHDQIVGLKFVQRYISSFGGNPNSVTIFGQSAGGESVCVLSLSPPAKGLFKRAIVQSGPCAYSYWQAQNVTYALELGKMVFDANNVSTISQLQEVPVEQIAWPDGPSESQFFNGYFAPDNYVLPKTAESMLNNTNNINNNNLRINNNINPVDMIIGSNSMDGTLTFVYNSLRVPIVWFHYKHRMKVLYNPIGIHPSIMSLRAQSVINNYPLSRFNSSNYNGASYAYIRSDSDRALVCPSKKLVQSFSNGIIGKVYHYVFEYGPILSSCDIVHSTNPICPRDEILHWASHGQENRIVFGTENGPDEISSPPISKHCDLTKEDKLLSMSMQKMWANFAKTGVPDVNWPSDGGISTMRIGSDGGISTNYRQSDCLFWKNWNEKYDDTSSVRSRPSATCKDDL